MVFSKVFSEAEAILNQEEFPDPLLIKGYTAYNEDTLKVIAQKIEYLGDIYGKIKDSKKVSDIK